VCVYECILTEVYQEKKLNGSTVFIRTLGCFLQKLSVSHFLNFKHCINQPRVFLCFKL